MKKILIISQGYWPEIFPINPVTKKLSEKDFKIDVLTGYPNYPKGKFFLDTSPTKLQLIKIITLKFLEFQLFQEE